MAETKGLVFLTGASGFIASQILSDLIEVYDPSVQALAR